MRTTILTLALPATLWATLWLALPAPAAAYWPTTLEENLPISATPNVIENGPTAIPLTDGNTLVAFFKDDLGICYQIVNRFGNFLFPQPQYVAPALVDSYNYWQKVVADEAGGAYVVWNRQYSMSDRGIFAQRLDSVGNRLWGDSGVRIYPIQNIQFDVCADSQGGFWMAIAPDQGCGAGADLYLQRVNAAGTLAFGDGGLLGRQIQGLRDPQIAPDGEGGCFVAWEIMGYAGGDDSIRAQHFDGNGNALWAQDLYICQNTDYYVRQMLPDGQGGFLMQADPGYVNYNTVWRINAQGQILWSRDHVSWWGSSEMVLGEPGFFYIGFYYTGGSVYAQRMDMNGNTYWHSGPGGVGALMYSRTGWYWSGDHFHYRYPYIYGVFDISNYPGYTNLLVVQKLDSLGNRLLGDYGATISAEETQYGEFVNINSLSDDEDAIIAVFCTGSGVGQDIYAKRCHADGTLGGPFPLQVTLTPHQLPIYIPPSGGNFSYDFAIADTTPVAGPADVWIEATLPNGSTLAIAARENLAFHPGDTLTRFNLRQSIPASAPPGTYTYTLCAGNHPYSSPWGQDSFSFQKLGQCIYPVFDSWWELNGFFATTADWEYQESPLPSQQHSLTLQPNPFNQETLISFYLPLPTQMRLTIYDVAGREVERLLEGSQPPGAYTISWRGDNVPSGIYLVRLEVDGEATVKKALLLK